MQAGWKKIQLGAASSAVRVKSCSMEAAPEQALPRALLPTANKSHPKNFLAAALGRFPNREADEAFPFGLRVLGSAFGGFHTSCTTPCTTHCSVCFSKSADFALEGNQGPQGGQGQGEPLPLFPVRASVTGLPPGSLCP